MSELVLDQVVAHRARPLFAPITTRLAPGTLLAVVGPNGAGKSSLLNAIIGSGIKRTGGVSHGGTSLHRLSARERARRVSFVGQDAFAANDLQVRDILEVGARAGGQRGNLRAAVHSALATLEIEHLVDRRYSHLSGGERQLVQVARMLAQASPVMLLDEPTSALDLNHQLRVMNVLRQQARAGHIVIVTIHDLTHALRWADVLVILASGRATVGSPQEIMTPERIRAVYGVTAEVFASPSGTPVISPIRLSCPTSQILPTRLD